MSSTINTMEKRNQLNVRLSNELRQAIQELADKENIPVSKLILVSLAKQYPELNDLILKH